MLMTGSLFQLYQNALIKLIFLVFLAWSVTLFPFKWAEVQAFMLSWSDVMFANVDTTCKHLQKQPHVYGISFCIKR